MMADEQEKITPMPMFTKTVALPAVRLSRTDLEDLTVLLNSEREEVWFSTSDRDVEYSGRSIEALLSQKAPDKVDNLRIRAFSDINDQMRKLVAINLVWHSSTCSAQSSNEVWAKGKPQQIKDFFKRRRRWYDRLRRPVMIVGLIFVGLMIGLLQDGDYVGSAVSGLAALGFLILSSPYPKGSLFPLVDIRLSETPRRWALGTVTAVLTLLVTFGGFIIALLQHLEHP